MKVVAFGASTHKTSINKALATYVASLVEGAEVKVLDINDYEMPLYTQDREEELAPLPEAQRFLDDIASADALVISFAEHNGPFSNSAIFARMFSGIGAAFFASSSI